MCQNLDLRFLLFIVFCQVFFPVPFSFFLLSVLLSFLLFLIWFFYRPLFSPYFSLVFCNCYFFTHVVSSLAYPNLLGNKRLDCCCCCCILSMSLDRNKSVCLETMNVAVGPMLQVQSLLTSVVFIVSTSVSALYVGMHQNSLFMENFIMGASRS
jgi:hypothetical protein